MEVFRNQTFGKREKLIEINQILISSCSVYLSGEYYTMDRAYFIWSHWSVGRALISRDPKVLVQFLDDQWLLQFIDFHIGVGVVMIKLFISSLWCFRNHRADTVTNYLNFDLEFGILNGIPSHNLLYYIWLWYVYETTHIFLNFGLRERSIACTV